MPKSFEKPAPFKQSEKKDDSGDFAKNPERKSWLDRMRYYKESLLKILETKRPRRKEMVQAILAAMVLFGNGSFVDAMTSGRPGARDAFWDNLTKQSHEMSQEDLKQRMEALFQINLISPSQMPEVTYYQDKKIPVAEWDKKKLMFLMRILNELPSYFYYPFNIQKGSSYESLKVNFILAENVDINTEDGQDLITGWCSCFRAQEVAPQVVFTKHLTEDQFRTLVVHELTHRMTLMDESYYKQKLFDILEVRSDLELRNLPLPKVSDIPELLRSASIIIEGGRLMVEWDERQIVAWARSKLSYGSKNNLEFMATAGEFYIFGKEPFLGVYNYLGGTKAEKLYEFIRQDIFLGKEYYPE